VNLPEVAAPPATEAAAASPATPPATVSPPLRRPAAGGRRRDGRAIYKPLPEIPEALRHRTLEMVAVARFRMAPNGVTQVELTEPTSEPELNRALLVSLKQWRFFPAMQDGRPVASTVDIRIPISLR
jgi:periplasmic protein TonB